MTENTSAVRRSHRLAGERRIVFHVGLDKTGTTSLQRYLGANQAWLKRHSILYPKRNLAFDGLNHTPLVAGYIRIIPRTGTFASPRRAAMRSSGR